MSLWDCINWTHFWAWLFTLSQAHIWLTPILPNDWRTALFGSCASILFLLIWPILEPHQ